MPSNLWPRTSKVSLPVSQRTCDLKKGHLDSEGVFRGWQGWKLKVGVTQTHVAIKNYCSLPFIFFKKMIFNDVVDPHMTLKYVKGHQF